MTDDFAGGQAKALRAVFARIVGADVAAFDAHALTITARPDPAQWPFSALIVGFGTGTVACFEEQYIEWAHAQPKQQYDRAGYMVIPLAREAARRGETLHPMPPMMGWALGREPLVPAVPHGYRVTRMDKAWMDDWQPKNTFRNALGDAAEVHRRFRNQYSFAAFTRDGEPAAVAGVYDTAGLDEIGVDVRPEHQGRRLAALVVSAAARAILEADGVPYYGCAVTNIRSQRTALASGFVPACSDATAMAAGIGLGETRSA